MSGCRACVACLSVLLVFSPAAARRDAQASTGKLASITASGSKKFSEEQIAAMSGLHLGDVVTRDDLQAAADRLAQLGLFSNVNYNFNSQGEKVALEFQLQDAPSFPVWFDNFPWFTDAELIERLKDVIPFFDGSVPEQGTVLDTITETLEKLLAARQLKAGVEHNVLARPDGPGRMMQFQVVGASLKVGAVEFGDRLAGEDKRVRERLTDLLGKAYSRFALELFAREQVLPLYLERGYMGARIGTPEVRFRGNPNRPLPDNVLAFVPVEPGPVYHWDRAEWSGNAAFGPDALNGLLSMTLGEVANGNKIQAAFERVRAEYGRHGYLDAKVEAEPVFTEMQIAGISVSRLSYRVTITEGAQYRMGAFIVTGLSLGAERKLLAAWRIARGEVFDKVYFDEFVERGAKQAFGDLPVHYDEIGRWLRTNPETNTVDVLLDFK